MAGRGHSPVHAQHKTRMSNRHFDSTDLTWLGRLASHLLRERQAAEDLVQDTVVAALQGTPPPDDGRRSWLAAVARRLAARRLRTDTRRARREASAADARPPAPADASELVARAELAEQLAAAARRLPEPFRRTILLRFLEGLSPSEIAERDGDPADTVRFRVRRGLALLREELERRHGDWSKCCVLLYPLARPYLAIDAAAVGSSSVLTTTAAAAWILMKTKWMAAVAVAIACGTGGWWLANLNHTPDATTPASSTAPPSPLASSQTGDDPKPGPNAANATITERIAAATSPAAAPPQPAGIACTVVDSKSQPIPNATAYLLARTTDAGDGPQVLLRTTGDAGGTFLIPSDCLHGDDDATAIASMARSIELRVVANGYLRHLEPNLPREPATLRIVMQRGRELRGKVIDTDGRAVPQLTLLAHSATKRLEHVSPSKVLLRATEAQLRMPVAEYEHNQATSDQQGFARFAGLPDGELSVRSVDPGWTIEPPANVGSDDRNVTWIARRRLGVELTVVDKASGMPVEIAHANFRVTLDFADGESQVFGKWVGSGRGKVSFVLGPGSFLPDFGERIITRAAFYGAVGTNDDNRTEWRAPALQSPMGASGVARVRVAVDQGIVAADGAETAVPETEIELSPRFDDGTTFVGRLYVRWESKLSDGRVRRGSESARPDTAGRHRLRVPAGNIQLVVTEGNASGSLPGWRGEVYGYAERITVARPVLVRGATATITRPVDWPGTWFVHASWRPVGETAWRGSWNHSTEAAELELRALSSAEWRFQLRRDSAEGPNPIVRTVQLTAGANIRVEH